jgi:hypothetical protein
MPVTCASVSIAPNPGIIVVGTPCLMTAMIASSVNPWSQAPSVRSGGCLPPCSWMIVISTPAFSAPCARGPWHDAQ